MNWNDVAGVLGQLQILPSLGKMFGGPLGEMAGAAAAKVLGVEPTPEAVRQAIEADPAGAASRLAEYESARSHDLELFKSEAGSSENARQMQIVAIEHDAAQEMTPSNLAYLNFAFTAAMAAALIAMSAFKVDVAPGVKEILGIILGVQLACLKDSQGFFFGTSRSSERNGAAMRNIAQSSSVPSPASQVGSAVGDALNKVVKR